MLLLPRITGLSLSLIKGNLLCFVVCTAITSRIRCRLVPNFGKHIRRFTDNVSELKQMTASDFEDLLQVCQLLGISI